jgi:hypothetical protein
MIATHEEVIDGGFTHARTVYGRQPQSPPRGRLFLCHISLPCDYFRQSKITSVRVFVMPIIAIYNWTGARHCDGYKMREYKGANRRVFVMPGASLFDWQDGGSSALWVNWRSVRAL